MAEGVPCKSGDRFQAVFCLTCDLPECVPTSRKKCPIKNGEFDDIQESLSKRIRGEEISKSHLKRLKKMKYTK